MDEHGKKRAAIGGKKSLEFLPKARYVYTVDNLSRLN
jgi:hypothetical protein